MGPMPMARKQVGLQGVIAANVRRLREGKGLSQEALAEVCGYDRTYVGGIERLMFQKRSSNVGLSMKPSGS